MPQAPRASTPTEVLAGLVDRVTFHNSENGFCVLRVKARGQRDLITLVGHAAMISAGEFVQASGAWINDRTHGVQFRASFLKATTPTRRRRAPASSHRPARYRGSCRNRDISRCPRSSDRGGARRSSGGQVGTKGWVCPIEQRDAIFDLRSASPPPMTDLLNF